MSEPFKSMLFAVAIVLAAAARFNGAWQAEQEALVVSARGPEAKRAALKERGQYGGDLAFLQRFYVGPRTPAESNHYFDLWSPGSLTALARFNGLTNNRALFIDSHGGAGFRWHGRGYGLYPRETLVPRGQEAPGFSPADFARVLGHNASAEVHNIVIAGCNEEGRFRSREWRRHFINATNVTYMTPGRLAYKPMFYQAIATPSSEIKPLFGREQRVSGRTECGVEREASPDAKPLGVYIADLYQPGARKPYLTRLAGRELLEPERPLTMALRADNTPAGNQL
jgi:hypothetical protein